MFPLSKIWLIFLLILIPIVSAVQIDSGTLVQSVGLGSTLNFTSTFYADVIQAETNSIYLGRFRTTDLGTEYLTMNITNVGLTGANAPYISASSSTQKTITSALSDSITATVVVNAEDCPINAVYQGNAVSSISCNGNTATFILTDIPSGDSLLDLNDVSEQTTADLCVNLMSAFGGFGQYIPTIFVVLGVLITITIVGLVIYAVKEKIIDLSDLNMNMDTSKAVMLGMFMLGILIFVAIILISALC